MRGLASSFFEGVLVPIREWLGSAAPVWALLLTVAAAVAGWAWLFWQRQRSEAESRTLREILGAVLERERARGELVLGRKDTLTVLRDLRRLAVGLRTPERSGGREDSGRGTPDGLREESG